MSRHRHTRDVFSARPIAVAADTPLICSSGGTDPSLLTQLRDGGLPVGTDLRKFRSEAEFTTRVVEEYLHILRNWHTRKPTGIPA